MDDNDLMNGLSMIELQKFGADTFTKEVKRLSNLLLSEISLT